MTEISVLDHKEINITETDDNRIRFSHNDRAYRMTYFEALKFALSILSIAIGPSDRPDEGTR